MENKLLTLHASRVLQTRAILQATSEEQEETEKAVRKASRKAGKKERLPQELTLQQKWEISNAEGDVTKAAIEECKTVQEKLIDELRALLEEADIKIAETSKDQYEFKRDVFNSVSAELGSCKNFGEGSDRNIHLTCGVFTRHLESP
eukprot:583198-Rhodomonas_salina.2